jgi:hypothetical protein
LGWLVRQGKINLLLIILTNARWRAILGRSD